MKIALPLELPQRLLRRGKLGVIMGRKIGSVLSFVLIFFEIISTLFLTPFIIRKFGQAEYGVYTLVISITSYLALLDLGVGNSVIKFVSSYRAKNQEIELKQFEGIINIYYLVIAGVTLFIAGIIILIFPIVFAKGLNESEVILSQRLLIITSINVAFTLGTAGFFYTIIGYENFIISKGLSIIFVALRIGISFIALFLGGTSIAIALINTISNIAMRLIIVFYVLFIIKLRPMVKGVQKNQVKSVIIFSVFVFLQMLATQINSMADNILIGIIVSDASLILAVYGVGATIKQYLSTLGGTINGVLMPGVVKIVECEHTNQDIEREMIRIGRIIFAFVGFVFCGFCVFGRQFIKLWAGEDYGESYFVAVILMSVYVIILTQNIGSQFLWAKNEHKEQSILKICIVITNIVLTILLIIWEPLYGAVIGTFISMLIGDVLVMQIVFKKKLKITLHTYYFGLLKGLLPSMLIATVGGVFFGLIGLNGWLGLFLNCLTMLIIYIICLFIFGLSNYERNLIRTFIHFGKDRT